jgi:hypothetical protein
VNLENSGGKMKQANLLMAVKFLGVGWQTVACVDLECV